jgi:hypothetical protein
MPCREDDLESKIIERIKLLTSRDEIRWELTGYKYTATYKGLYFEIEDTGQNWLYIDDKNGENISLIMDTAKSNGVQSLLETIKNSSDIQRASLSNRQLRLAGLEEAWDKLKEAEA